MSIYRYSVSANNGQKIDISSSKPTRTISGATEETTRAIQQQDGFNIQYELEYKEWMERRNKLKEGMFKAYSLIQSEYCNKTMQARIEHHPEYDSKIQDNPIELLEVIKSLMHNPVMAQYPKMHEAVIRLINIRQYEGEALLDYVRRFKQFVR